MTQFIDSLYVEDVFEKRITRAITNSQAQAATTISLTVASATCQIFTGNTAGQIVRLPVATTLKTGWVFEIHNDGTQAVTIYLADGTTIVEVLRKTSYGVFVLLDASTSNGIWTNHQSGVTFQRVSASVETTTGSATYVDLAGMTLTAQTSGWYDCAFEAEAGNTNNGAGSTFVFNVNGTNDLTTERNAYTSGGVLAPISFSNIYYLLTGQIIKVQWKRTTNTGRCTNRSLIAGKVG